MRKYRNIPVEHNGYRFDSKAEARRYQELQIMEAEGEIFQLRIHPSWVIAVNGKKICIYRADFSYFRNPHQDIVVEDVKAFDRRTGKFRVTQVYRLKKKLMQACHGILIQEVAA